MSEVSVEEGEQETAAPDESSAEPEIPFDVLDDELITTPKSRYDQVLKEEMEQKAPHSCTVRRRTRT